MALTAKKRLRKHLRRAQYVPAPIARAIAAAQPRSSHRGALPCKTFTPAKAWLPNSEAIFAAAAVPTGSGYVQAKISSEAMPQLLAWVAPNLLQCTGAILAERPTVGGRMRSGIVFVSAGETCSGMHADPDDGLLHVAAKGRKVTVCRPESVPDAKQFHHRDGVRMVKDEYAPKVHGVYHLRAGDALFLPRLWWHQVEGEAGGIALSIDVASGLYSQPKHFLLVGKRPPQQGWSSAKTFVRLLSRRNVPIDM